MYVLIVGWDIKKDKNGNDVEYFIVKSHMGQSWGDNGFFWISTDQADGNGACGILTKNLIFQIS